MSSPADLRRWIDSCAIVSFIRAVFGSGWPRLLESSLIARRLVWPQRSVRFDPVEHVAIDSTVVLAIERLLDSIRLAWHEASVTRHAAVLLEPRIREDFRRIQLAGWFAAPAVVTHIALIGPTALAARPVVALVWVACFLVALACIVRPVAVSVAWHDSRLRRWAAGHRDR